VSAAPLTAVHQGQPQAAAVVAPDASCYSQTGTDSGSAILSQNFTDAGGVYDQYDSASADDFTLTKTCTANGLMVTGQYFNGTGPATSVDVTYYKNKKSHPGKVVKTFAGLAPTGSPNFNLKHGKAKLVAGHYWVSPVVNMNFGGGLGEWGWEVINEVTGAMGNFQNPGGGFTSPAACPTWDTIATCTGISGDFIFTVKGK
jgi:hypothetical protein